MEMTSAKVYALIQARMSSNRFPEKVIQELESRPMIFHQIERVLKSHSIDAVYVLTSTDSSDDILCKILLGAGIKVFRGNLLRDAFLVSKKSHLTKYQEEHVTPFIYQNPQKFKLGNIVNVANLSKFRCTVDTKDDFLAIVELLKLNPGLSADSKFSTLESAICSPNNPLQVTEPRKAITQGPWMDYSFPRES